MNGSWARLRGAAWIAIVAHAVAGLAMLLVLRHGLETNADLAARLRFLADQRAAWTAAWLVWNAAALSILYFCVAFAAAHSGGRGRAPFTFAVALCSAAIACDLAAESIEMGLLPMLTEESGRFLLVHRAAVLLTGYVANGLYTAAIFALWWLTRRAYSGPVAAVGLLTCLAGVALSAAALSDSVAGMFWSNAVLVPGLLAWLAAVASDASKRALAEPA